MGICVEADMCDELEEKLQLVSEDDDITDDEDFSDYLIKQEHEKALRKIQRQRERQRALFNAQYQMTPVQLPSPRMGYTEPPLPRRATAYEFLRRTALPDYVQQDYVYPQSQQQRIPSWSDLRQQNDPRQTLSPDEVRQLKNLLNQNFAASDQPPKQFGASTIPTAYAWPIQTASPVPNAPELPMKPVKTNFAMGSAPLVSSPVLPACQSEIKIPPIQNSSSRVEKVLPSISTLLRQAEAAQRSASILVKDVQNILPSASTIREKANTNGSGSLDFACM